MSEVRDLSPREREFLSHNLDWIAQHGRVANSTETLAAIGVSQPHRTMILASLERKGWIARTYGQWWPLGVTRTIAFGYPASEITDRAAAIVKMASRAPSVSTGFHKSMRGFRDLVAKCREVLGLDDPDAETLAWAEDEVERLRSELAHFKAMCRQLVQDYPKMRGALFWRVDVRRFRLAYEKWLKVVDSRRRVL